MLPISSLLITTYSQVDPSLQFLKSLSKTHVKKMLCSSGMLCCYSSFHMTVLKTDEIQLNFF